MPANPVSGADVTLNVSAGLQTAGAGAKWKEPFRMEILFKMCARRRKNVIFPSSSSQRPQVSNGHVNEN